MLFFFFINSGCKPWTTIPAFVFYLLLPGYSVILFGTLGKFSSRGSQTMLSIPVPANQRGRDLIKGQS